MNQPKLIEPPSNELEKWKPLKSVEGVTVGWTCRECGRLFEADHVNSCSQQADTAKETK
ncbi:MAG TPA: hypothetical protein VN976_21795 [Verrucomicrobiae bacterium]|nr:hypothetical protein [Verrucomicrobiae bacterium]